MSDESPEVTVTKKHKGWPKGKLRGPRLPKGPVEQAPIGDPPPILSVPPLDLGEPVKVEVIYKTGQAVAFGASVFDISGPEYRFTSYPERRGYKTMHIIQKIEVAAISIQAPEQFFATVPPPAVVTAPSVYPGGDPTVSIAPRPNNRAIGAMQGGVPRSVATVFDKGEVKDTVIGAAMV